MALADQLLFLPPSCSLEKAAAGNAGNVLVLNFDGVMTEGEKKFTKL
ncbi:MAG: hypothetical protein V8Q21_12020 [Akkermansia muciniphila]